MRGGILLLIFLFLVSCGNRQSASLENATEDRMLVLPDSVMAGMYLCTEFPMITDDTSSNGIKEAGALKYLLWPKYTKALNIAFLDGDTVVQENVKRVAREWEQYCGITLNFSQQDPPNITISFRQKGVSWSAIGKSSNNRKPSMNLGWLDKASGEQEYQRVVLHEFGHALGLIHEHQNPLNNPIHWDTAMVYSYYSGSPYRWSKRDVEYNFFKKYEVEEINGTAFDSLSIMLYAYPARLTTDGYSTQWNSQLSETDKQWIEMLYPKN